MDEHLVKGHLPVVVRGVLAGGPGHGYAIAREIRRRADGALRLGEGTLYPLLYRLEGEGLVRAQWEPGVGSRGRKVYRITRAGRRRIAKARGEWVTLCGMVREFMGEGWVEA